ncbi:MAG: FIST C-terminal domain-containing protein [Syntrophobacterales bacterium]|jgi:hypothetical protein|nr:FIST C-terminal domain-containing protein [Syntrophobacterales bacterium]
MPSQKKTKVGIGFCNREDAYLSGVHVAREALESGTIERPDFVYAFCSGDLDHERFFAGLTEVVGQNTPIVGGSAIGVLTNEQIRYDGASAGAAIIESDRIRHRVVATGLNDNLTAAGREVAELLSDLPDDRLIMLFYEWVKETAKGGCPPVLNSSTHILEGFGRDADCQAPLIGAGLVGSYQLEPGKQFCGSFVGAEHAVGVALSGDFSVFLRIMHGCAPLDGTYHTITKSEGPVIYELDGRPIVDIMDNLFGHKEWRNQQPIDYLAIGVNLGERYGVPVERDYVNRMLISMLPDGSGVSMFEPGLEEGMEIQFMLRDTRKMVESAAKNSQELIETIVETGKKKPVFAFYIDCAGRTMQSSSSTEEEAGEVQKVCNQYGIPLLGLFTGVEIAPLRGYSRGLDWTGVLVVVAEDE